MAHLLTTMDSYTQASAEQGVGEEVEEDPVAGFVVPAAQMVAHYQRVHAAYLADMHPHQTNLHLPEECCPHCSGFHALFMCGQDS